MKLDSQIYEKMSEIEWFSRCGIDPPDRFDFETEQVRTLEEALRRIRSEEWRDARTHALGELTEYLAGTDYDLYGLNWNQLAKESRKRIQTEVMPTVLSALKELGAEDISDSVLLDLNRIALEATWRKRFPKAPRFFAKLLQVYEYGRLPCGWSGNLDSWPAGRLLVY